MEKSYPIIAKEGWLFLAIAFFASALLTYIQNPLSWIAWTVTLFILQFFRDPLRNKPSKKNVILSAADGKVIAIEKMTNPYTCLLYTSPSPRDATLSRMPSSA